MSNEPQINLWVKLIVVSAIGLLLEIDWYSCENVFSSMLPIPYFNDNHPTRYVVDINSIKDLATKNACVLVPILSFSLNVCGEPQLEGMTTKQIK